MRFARLLAAAAVSAAVFGLLAPFTGLAGADPHATGGSVLTQPQPLSTADQTNTGANDTSSGNQYLSTRNGSPSQNGSGTGSATGQPCAGCVGKADNKNPPGQYPNGSDANNGYECDGNQGIGQSNPAHTGCQPGTTTTTTTEPGGTTTTTGPGGTTTTTGASGTTTTTTTDGGSGTRGDSGATGGGSGQSGQAKTEVQLQKWLATAPATKAAGGTLALTGADIGKLVLAALFSLALGAAFYALEPQMRRRAQSVRP